MKPAGPLKILVLSNFYPPHNIGGYGMLCMEVAEGLARKGHTFDVLTSTHGVDRPVVQGKIHRLLELESDLHFYKPGRGFVYPGAKRANLQHLRRLASTIRPDLIFVWGMWCLSKQLAAEAEHLMGSRTAYYLANPWPIEPNLHRAYWDMPAARRSRRPAKWAVRLLARIVLRSEWQSVPLRFEHAACCSRALRDQLLAAGVPLQHAPVIYEGIELKPYLAQADRRNGRAATTELGLLYVGILAPHKGVHTAIEALSRLPPGSRSRTRLTILGAGHPQYEQHLHDLVRQFGLTEIVSFRRPIPRLELPEFLGRFEVLLLPSSWEEPLARIMQEGLASGMVVVGSANGGTKEVIVHESNGLLFPAGDASALAMQIERLIDNPALCADLAGRGRRTAAELFDIERMVEEIEQYLVRVVESPLPPAH